MNPIQNVVALTEVSLVRRTREEYDYDLKSRIFSVLEGRYRRPTRRTILQDITLNVARGTRLGIIGPNGAGKTTLLKVIAGILIPTTGSVTTSGRIAPLLELGAGFEPDLSVEDNVTLYGVLLGASRIEMLAKLRTILAYAELEDYRRYPVRHLSAGMTARLGFAVATEVEPDIVMLDEVLSVGDEAFRKKSRRRIDGFMARGVTTLVVSHDLQIIRETCEHALWLDQGRIGAIGEVESTIVAYLRSVDERALAAIRTHRPYSVSP